MVKHIKSMLHCTTENTVELIEMGISDSQCKRCAPELDHISEMKSVTLTFCKLKKERNEIVTLNTAYIIKPF